MLANVEGVPDELFEIADLLVTFDREVVQDATFARVERHPEELLLDELNLRDWQRDIHVGLEGDRDAVAIRTPHGRLVQPMHQINDD